MHKIVYLPLDERPNNWKFPATLFECDTMHIVTPERLGDKRHGADWADIRAFLVNECADAEGLVLSLDMLLYGGLIPSRIHDISKEELLQRLDLLNTLREENPDLLIYGFQHILRCHVGGDPAEEPDYWSTWGESIYRLGVARHRYIRGDQSAKDDAMEVESTIPDDVLEDFLFRRTTNHQLNIEVLNAVRRGVIDFLLVPQDDAAPLGYTALDQSKVRMVIRQMSLQGQVMCYPSRDEASLTLLARMRNCLEKRNPAVYILYAAIEAPTSVPLQEDRPMGETVRYQVLASGCHMSSDAEHADFALAVSAPGRNMTHAAVQPRLDPDYDVGRGLTPFFVDICHLLDQNKPVSICDNAYLNGGDLELLDMLDVSERLLEVAGYAGCSTSASTMGNAIAQGVQYLYGRDPRKHRDCLIRRYVLDCGYGSIVRWAAVRDDLPRMGLNYFDTGEANDIVARGVERRLNAFVQDYMPSIAGHIQMKNVHLPWKRMEDLDLDIAYT